MEQLGQLTHTIRFKIYYHFCTRLLAIILNDMNNMNNNTYRDNYDNKSVWYQLIQYLSQAEVNECARIIGTYIIEDNQVGIYLFTLCFF